MAHRNARLTEFGRLLLVQRITELGWPPAQAAESLGVSRATAYKWLDRYRSEGRVTCSAISTWRCSQASSSGPYIGTTGSLRSSRWRMTAMTRRLAGVLLQHPGR
jgi:hypothetical protein